MTEAELIIASKTDPAGFRELYDRLAEGLLVYFYRRVQSGETVYALDVLGYFAAQGQGDFEWLDHLRWIRKPMLVIVGRFDRFVIEKAAPMAHVEQPMACMDAVCRRLVAQGALLDPSATAG